jgi:hypothetical protein
MRVWSLLIGILAAALLISGPVAAECSVLHRGETWLMVQEGDEVFEYIAESRRPDWHIRGAWADEGIVCANCGQLRFTSTSERNTLLVMPRVPTLRGFREIRRPGFRTVYGPHSVELGPLKGEAQRFSETSSTRVGSDIIILEASDGCVDVTLFVQDTISLDSSPFSSVQAITEATVLQRIPRGPIASFDLRCISIKSTLLDFSSPMPQNWHLHQLRTNLPVPAPSHEEFMQGYLFAR